MKKIALAVAASLSFAAFAGAPPAHEGKEPNKPVEATKKKVMVGEAKKEEALVVKKEDAAPLKETLKPTEKKAETKPAAAVPTTK